MARVPGTWIAAGSRESIPLGNGRQASTAKLEGSLVLAGASRPAAGYRAAALVLSDTATGLVGRAVWTDDRGDQIFSELKGKGTSTGSHIVGTFVGGTGRYAGATGSTNSRGVLYWRRKTERARTIDGAQWEDPRRLGPSHAGRGPAMKISVGLLIKRALPFALGLGIWFMPVPAGLTAPAWHLFAVFVSAICRAGRCVPAPDVHNARGGRRRPHRDITPAPKRSPVSPIPACCSW